MGKQVGFLMLDSGPLGHGRPATQVPGPKKKQFKCRIPWWNTVRFQAGTWLRIIFLLHYDVSIIQAQFRGALHKSLVAPKCKMFQGSADEEFGNRVWQAAILPIVLKTRRLYIRSLFLAGTAFSIGASILKNMFTPRQHLRGPF